MTRRPATTPRRTPRQERARFTVTALLDATARVVVQHGYHGASTNRIARVAGVNIGSVYQYFPSKEALVAALIDRHLEHVSRVLAASVAESEGAPLSVAVRAMVQAHILIHTTNPGLHRVLIEQIPSVDRLNPVEALRARVMAGTRAWLSARGHELAVSDLDFAAFAVVVLVDELTRAAVRERPDYITDDRLVDGLCDIVVGYLTHRDHRSRC
jgi:AcrR family transcriptional regulator